MNTFISIIAGIVFGSVLVAAAAPRIAEAAAPEPTKITFQRAADIAVAYVGSGTVDDIDRDRYRGRVVYEVEVMADDGREHEVVVDANDGKVLRAKIDD